MGSVSCVVQCTGSIGSPNILDSGRRAAVAGAVRNSKADLKDDSGIEKTD